MQAVIQTARACGWQASLHLREDSFNRPDIIGFSLYTPLQFPNIPAWLRDHDLDPRAINRYPDDPPIIAGGPACANPAPILPFFDAFVMGDAEVTLPAILHTYEVVKTKDAFLDVVAELPSVYVPNRSTSPVEWRTVPRANVITLDHPRKITHILAARGCRYHCTFCQIPRLQSPYRPIPLDQIGHAINTTYTPVSLIAPSFIHHPDAYPILNVLAAQQRYIYSTNACHRDLTHSAIHTLKRVSARITIGVEGTSERLRKSVGKPISDGYLEKLILTLMTNFVIVQLYIIVGLPEETVKDQQQFDALIRRILRNRPHSWTGKPAMLRITPTPFQAMPHTTLERAPSPSAHILQNWRNIAAQLRADHKFLIIVTIKATTSANINFALHRARPEMAAVIERMGKLPLQAWRDYVQRRFVRLCEEHEVELQLGPLARELPWKNYNYTAYLPGDAECSLPHSR